MKEENFSNRLKEAIQSKNMKQSELVSKTGIPKSSISSYLSGKYVPKQTNIYKLANALNVEPAWLMGTENKTFEQDLKLNNILNHTQLENIEQLVKKDKEKKLIQFLDLSEILFYLYPCKFNEYTKQFNDFDKEYYVMLSKLLNEIHEKNNTVKNIKCGTNLISIESLENNLFWVKKNVLLHNMKKYYSKQDILEEILKRNVFDITDENGKSTTDNKKRIKALENYLDYILKKCEKD